MLYVCDTADGQTFGHAIQPLVGVDDEQARKPGHGKEQGRPIVSRAKKFDSGVGGARRNAQLGQLFFFFNCLASSLEVVTWRRLLRRATSPLQHCAVMAESYLVAASFMACACIAASRSPAAVEFFCPECKGNAWHLPTHALLAVAYSVVFQTIVGYVLMAWALRHAEPSLASIYSTMQPIMATAVVVAVLMCGFNPGGVLSWPGWEMLGGVLIIAGLFVVEGVGSSKPPVPSEQVPLENGCRQ